jgi:DNA polymerase
MSNKNKFNHKEAKLVKSCKLFPDATNIVVGRGNEKADILFIGEAPGKNEDERGIPFCGRAGQNLDKLLHEVDLSIEEIYIANILKLRPPKNRDPTKEEIKLHTPWLLKQIKDMKPKIICTLGNYATKFFLAKTNIDEMKKQPGITEVHGQTKKIEIEGIKIKLIPIFHPAAIIYNRKLEPLWIKDMEIVKKHCK